MPKRLNTRLKPGPKKNHNPPAYRHYKPKDLAVVRIEGKDYYLGKHGSPESWEKYHRLLAEFSAHGERQPEPGAVVCPGAERTVNEIATKYLDFAEAYYVKNGKPTSEAGLIRASFVPLFKLFGRTLAKDFGPKSLKTVRQAFIDEGLSRTKNLSRTEINRRTAHIVRMFKWAVSEELVPPSVHHGLAAVGGLRKGRTEVRESDPVKPVADAAVDAVRPFVAAEVWAMIELQRLTGMRPGEVQTMRTCDLDVTGKVWLYTPESHKTEHHGRQRVIAIGPRAQAVLKPWLKPYLTAYLFSPRRAEENRTCEMRLKRKTRVQPSQRNRRKKGCERTLNDRYTNRAYHHAIARACGQAFPHPRIAKFRDAARRQGLAREERRKILADMEEWADTNADELKAWRQEHHWHPNQLRHNAATAIRREFGLDTSRAVLGHSDAKTTTIYAERDIGLAAEAMLKLG